MKNSSKLKRKHAIKILPVVLIIAVVFAAACQSRKPADTPENRVVVKSPASGVITKVLASEGAKVGENAGIVEIETGGETTNALPEKDLNKQSTATVQYAQQEVDTAQKQVERASIEVERMQSLIASNSAPQSQLDAARADFQRAQEKLQAAQTREKSRETQMLIEKSRAADSSFENIQPPKIVTVRVPVAGTLKVLNARAGQKVTTGQILATIEKD